MTVTQMIMGLIDNNNDIINHRTGGWHAPGISLSQLDLVHEAGIRDEVDRSILVPFEPQQETRVFFRDRLADSDWRHVESAG